MTKMSKAQRTAILEAHNWTQNSIAAYRGELPLYTRRATIAAMEREGWVTGPLGTGFRCVTRAGLIAAGVDMDALHAEALEEDKQRSSADGAVEVEQELPAEGSWKHPYVEQGGRCGTCGFGRESNRHPGPDMPCMAMVSDSRTRTGFRAQVGHDHLLATGPECNDAWPITPAEQHAGSAGIADEVAALRDAIERWMPGPLRRVKALARLDRIAALVPQRATSTGGRGLWRHACGDVKAFRADPNEGQHERRCYWCYKPGAWRALYTVPGR